MYTDEQYAMMERLEDGFVWQWHTDLGTDAMLRHLMDEKICQAREDVCPGFLALTEHGKCVLSAREREAEQRKQDVTQKKADKNEQRIFEVFKIFLTIIATLLVEHFLLPLLL